MADLKKWSSSAGGNSSGSTPDFPVEGMSPSSVNDTMREIMAAVRRQHEDAEWIDLGYTPTYASSLSFTLAGNRANTFHANRRVRANDATVLYGYVTSSTYSTNTRVSVSLDSGSLSASLTGVAVGILSFDNRAIPNSFATLAVKVIEIGDWNMDTTTGIVVAHGLTFTNIRSVSGIIRSDDNTVYYPISLAQNSSQPDVWISTISSSTLSINRRTAGYFDDLTFDSTSYNRGWITIHYTP